MPREPDQYRQRTDRIVAMARRYRRLYAAAVSQLHFGGTRFQSANVLNSLSQANGPLVAHSRKIPGGLSEWVLSSHGAAQLGLQPETTNSGNVNPDLGTLDCCVFSEPRHHRLMHEELVRIFGDAAPKPNIVHILTGDEPPRVLRVYQATRDIRYTIKRLTEIREVTCRHAALAGWVRDWDYGIACLVPRSQMIAPYRQAIERHGITRLIAIDVLLGPTAETLAAELRKRRAKNG
jgi:hypothetical protein